MDTGYYKETDVILKPIDIFCQEDQAFLYDVILYRWKHHDIVNITHKTPHEPPTYEQHVKYLKNNVYKGIYRICLEDLTVGTVYIDNNNVFSIFILPHLLKNALKKKTFKRNDKKKITTMIVHQLMKLNSDVKTFYVGINPKNSASLKAAEAVNCDPVEYVFGCSNIFYENGG